MRLVEIAAPHFDVELDIAYATPANITGAPIYARPGCYLLEPAAGKLARAIELAAALGYRFRVYDAFRPKEAQWVLWNHTPDPDFLADPRRGSPHSRGIAVDLTLLDAAGEALDMGTGFDAFTERSHHGRTDVSPAAQANRLLLLGIMTAAGWDNYMKEWWHYQLFEPRAYPVLGDAELPIPMMPR